MLHFNKTYKAISWIFLVISFTSCKKFIEVSPPADRLVSSTVFTSDASATAALTGIYSSMINQNFGFACAGMTLYPGLSADEFNNYSSTATQLEFSNNSLTVVNSTIGDLWNFPYNNIYSANSVIEGLQNSSSVSLAVKNQLLGEAKFIRAFCHFCLVNLFGDVPLVTTTDYRKNTIIARMPKDQVYQQIVTDLTEAQLLLVNDYSFSSNERVRPNKWAATALLSRAYLYMGKYAEAEAQSASILNNTGLYSLVNNLNNVFLKNSQESIWQLMPGRPNQNTNEGRFFILTTAPSSSTPGITISNSLLNAFENGDARKSAWINSITAGNNIYYFPFKYKVKTVVGTILTEYYTVLRLSEQFLIRAEARAQENNISGAQTDLNSIRNRAGLPNTTANDKSTLLKAIEQERRVELFAEWGHRWLDLKRTNRADSVLLPVKLSNWQPTDALYPIPQIQIDNDPNVSQNAGY